MVTTDMRICVRDEHAVHVDADGGVWTRGKGSDGQLGHDHSNSSPKARRVAGLPPCVSVSAGENFTFALARDGRLFSWGKNHRGQLGHGDRTTRFTPCQVEGLPLIRAVVCGSDFTFAIDHEDGVWSFGANSRSQTGVCSQGRQEVLLPVRLKLKASMIACGWNHSLMIGTDQKLYGCGCNEKGQLGLQEDGCKVLSPLPFSGIPAMADCGNKFSMVITAEGAVYGSGYNWFGIMGLPTLRSDCLDQYREFTPVPGALASQISCGDRHTLVVDRDGWLWGWGCASGVLYDKPDFLPPTRMLAGVSSAVAGSSHTLISTSHQRVEMRGGNKYGVLSTPADEQRISWKRNMELSPETLQRVPHQLLPLSLTNDYSAMNLDSAEKEFFKSLTLSAHFAAKSTRPAPLSLGSWDRCAAALHKKLSSFQVARQNAGQCTYAKYVRLKSEARLLEQQLAEKQAELDTLRKENLSDIEEETGADTCVEVLHGIADTCKNLGSSETQQTEELRRLLHEHSLCDLTADQMPLVWWRMDLSHRQEELKAVSGDLLLSMSACEWVDMGLTAQEASRVSFMAPILALSDGLDRLAHLEGEDCIVCECATVASTINILREREVKMDESKIARDGWILPYLIYAPLKRGDLGLKTDEDFLQGRRELTKMRKSHQDYLRREATSD